MSLNSKLAFTAILCTALGAGAVQGLHAQAKHKAYVISELEVIDAAAQKAYASRIETAQTAAGGRNLHTAGGKVVAIVGQAPKLVAVSEWDSLEAAEAFYKSKAWSDLEPEQKKAVKTIARYAVEALR
jgi:uncharacterized protein (DUF1330 family)